MKEITHEEILEGIKLNKEQLWIDRSKEYREHLKCLERRKEKPAKVKRAKTIWDNKTKSYKLLSELPENWGQEQHEYINEL